MSTSQIWERFAFIRKGNSDVGPIVATIDYEGFIHIGDADINPIIYCIDYEGFVRRGDSDIGPIEFCIDWPFIRRGNSDIGPIVFTIEDCGSAAFLHVGCMDCTPIAYTLTEDY